MPEIVQMKEVDVSRIYEQIDIMKNEINDLKLNKVELKVIVGQFLTYQKEQTANQKEQTSVNKELSNTMIEVKFAMQEVKNSLQENKCDIDSLNTKVDSLNNKVHEQANKGKIDVNELQVSAAKKGLSNVYSKIFVSGMSIIGIGNLIGLIILYNKIF